MAALHRCLRRLRSGMASRIHLIASVLEEVEVTLLQIITTPMRREVILLITITPEGCHLHHRRMIGTVPSVRILCRQEDLRRSISTVTTVTISSTRRYRLVRHHSLYCLDMLRQATIMIAAIGILRQVLCGHHQSLQCLLPQITMSCHLRVQQIRHCFLSFPALWLRQHFHLVLTPCIKLTRCQMQIVTMDQITMRDWV